MSKDKISDYSATANSNTDIAGINIDEGCAPSGINNAIRTLMKQLKDFQQGTNSDSFNGPTNGAHNGTVGATTPAAGTFTTLTASGNVVLGDASTDTLNVGNGGLIKDASGNLGLGVTPSAWYSDYRVKQIGLGSCVYGRVATNETGITQNFYRDASAAYKYIGNGYAAAYTQLSGGGHAWLNGPNNSSGAGAALTLTQAMTLDASGNLANIGTMSSSGWQAGYTNTAATVYNGIYAPSSNTICIATGGSERSRIDSSGNLLVGTTTTSGITNGASANAHNFLSFEGNVNAQRNNGACFYASKASGYTNSEFHSFYVNGSNVGSITTTGSATAYNTSSDYRLKDITGNLTGYKERVMALQPKQGTWKANGSEFRGFLAHEFAESYSSSVTGEKDAVDADGNPVMQAMQASSSEVMADLVALVQELVAENQALKARLDAANL